MFRTRLSRLLVPPFILVVLAIIVVVSLSAVISLDGLHRRQVERQLENEARLIRNHMAEAIEGGDSARVDVLARELGNAIATRVTVIDASGVVLGDSEVAASTMDNHGDRPEVREALNGRTGRATRFSFTRRQDMAYVALPILKADRVVGVVRTSLPTGATARDMRGYYLAVGGVGAVVALLAVLASVGVWRRVGCQLDVLKSGAERFANGELGARIAPTDTHAFAELTEAMNAMGRQLDERMQTVFRQRNELEAVLASMIEAVVAVDLDERVLNLNRAAAELFEADPTTATGRSVQETIRNPELQRLITRTLSSQETVEDDVTVYHDGEHTLHVLGTVLRDGRGRIIGALLVLNDVTRLRRLESARRDFVANVSHELRTPITSIKGYIETLLDGETGTEDAERFLRIVQNQADRLNSLIDDLLMLARVEDEAERETLARDDVRLREVLERAIQACVTAASARNVRVELDCDPEAAIPINATLIEQAVVNLLDNAIKYSPDDGTVRIDGQTAGDEFAIHVVDHGCGIASEHLPRLFERFYRVDKARSRKLGGTGLGLAIVKHIVRLHGGRTEVTSTLGEGSTFSVHLPISRHSAPGRSLTEDA